jgi:two-component system phosphate regulon sensor histidine kinase PhoR
VLVAALSALVAGTFLHHAIGLQVTEQIAANLTRQARLLRDLAAEEADLRATADALADRAGRTLGVRATILAADGTVLGDSELDGPSLARAESHAGRPEVREALARGAGRAERSSTTVAERLLYVALRLDPADPERGVVRLAVPLTEVREARQATFWPIVSALSLSVLAAAAFGHLAARRQARRLEEMSRTAAEIAGGRLGARAAADGADEVAALAGALNRMADQQGERLTLLARERNQLRAVVDGMVEGVVAIEAGGRIVLANGAFERMFGARPPVEGRRPLEVARVPALQEALDEALRADHPTTREMALGGVQEKVIRASLAALRDGEATVGAVAVFHDVTELKRLERARREFVANVSHELRTPLTAIKGYAENLRDGGLQDPAVAAQFVDVIHRNAERLRSLIEDLLDLSSVEQGQARLTLGPVRLADVVAQAAAVIRPAAQKKGQTLTLDLAEGLSAPRADRDRLAQVLINLLENAVKFTPEGGRIAVSGSAAPGRVVLSVSDTGVGIPPDEVPRIFERFYRVDRSRDRREGGTGLGLAIAKHLVQAMGGTIQVESAQGAGTTFRVTLPAA